MEIFANLFIEQQDSFILEPALKCLWEILYIGSKLGSKENIILKELKTIPGFIDKLEILQYHTDNAVYNELNKIFAKFFTMEIEEL